jgi:bifunctional non-homologous end joining protein LigD
LLVAGDDLDRNIRWIRPELTAEVRVAGWSGKGRVRHPAYLGLREEKSAEVVREPLDPEKPRRVVRPQMRAR